MNRKWPWWVVSRSLQSARATAILYVIGFIMVLAGRLSGDDPSLLHLDVAVVAVGAPWAVAQWVFIRRQFQRLDDELDELVKAVASGKVVYG
ncbi:hypothetical protein, partial [Microbacterium sp. C448]|uniref:hypothetical protein n=1 Tax=Microbacterium sp. C448 TaxID=1177594 RepID=UPI0005614BA3